MGRQLRVLRSQVRDLLLGVFEAALGVIDLPTQGIEIALEHAAQLGKKIPDDPLHPLPIRDPTVLLRGVDREEWVLTRILTRRRLRR